MRSYELGSYKHLEIGLEPSPDAYIASMMDVMAEVWRVLRDDGSCWVNLGDSYAGGKGRSGHADPEYQAKRVAAGESYSSPAGHVGGQGKTRPQDRRDFGIAPKNLALIPFRFALACQEQGWIVRQTIVWKKPNPLPESMRDRPTTSHEYIFLLAKQKRYFYDCEAIRESGKEWMGQAGTFNRLSGKATELTVPGQAHVSHRAGRSDRVASGRNARSVWEITTQPFKGAHFSTWPEKLVKRMILAGTSEKGCCPECGKQWERVVERESMVIRRTNWGELAGNRTASSGTMLKPASSKTVGWQPACVHYDGRYRTEFPKARSARKRYQRDVQGDWWKRVRKRPGLSHWPVVPAIALDPFVGSGTTVKVARELGRRAIGLDLSMSYLRLAQERCGLTTREKVSEVVSSDYINLTVTVD